MKFYKVLQKLYLNWISLILFYRVVTLYFYFRNDLRIIIQEIF